MASETRGGRGLGTLAWGLVVLIVVLVVFVIVRGSSVSPADVLIYVALCTGWIVYWMKSHRLR